MARLAGAGLLGLSNREYLRYSCNSWRVYRSLRGDRISQGTDNGGCDSPRKDSHGAARNAEGQLTRRLNMTLVNTMRWARQKHAHHGNCVAGDIGISNIL